jgi:transcriptional regulator with XRE-family HTH domain
MSLDSFYSLVQKIKTERKLRGLTLSVLSKQARIRQELLEKIENTSSDYTFSKPEQRQILKLANFLKVDYLPDLNNLESKIEDSSSFIFKAELPPVAQNKSFFVFTARNLNVIFLTLLSFSVLFLIGLPAFLVVRPAEIFWDDKNVQNSTLVIKKLRQIYTGSTARAKSMTFGEQVVILKDGTFSLDLPQPKQAVVVPLVLTNYFNLVTEYEVVLKPGNP